jgi:hypothetical protein
VRVAFGVDRRGDDTRWLRRSKILFPSTVDVSWRRLSKVCAGESVSRVRFGKGLEQLWRCVARRVDALAWSVVESSKCECVEVSGRGESDGDDVRLKIMVLQCPGPRFCTAVCSSSSSSR